MATSLATARASVSTALTAAMTGCNHYRRRQTDYKYPAVVVGWPQEFNVRPTLGAGERDITLDVWVACELGDDDSTDDLLSSLLESAVTALLGTAAWDVQPVTDFGEQVTADERTVIWCRLPVAVMV